MTNKKKVLLTILIIIVVLCGGAVVGYFYFPIGYADDEVIGNLSLMEMKSVYKYSAKKTWLLCLRAGFQILEGTEAEESSCGADFHKDVQKA